MLKMMINCIKNKINIFVYVCMYVYLQNTFLILYFDSCKFLDFLFEYCKCVCLVDIHFEHFLFPL